MNFLPKFNLDVAKTVREFMRLLRSIEAKLDRLIKLQEQTNGEH